LQHIA